MKVISDYNVKYGGEYHAPSKPFDMTPEDAEEAIAAGKVKSAAAIVEAAEEEVKELTVKELQTRAKELEIDLDTIKGTGKGGAVLKADLVKAIAEAEAAGDEDDRGEDGEPGNPSVAE
jgi:pyruvate/2-oxoglutarate dehydrogenase complex dihydrolipoamide acyltransferase (E2) component